jgi:hypothetical protein
MLSPMLRSALVAVAAAAALAAETSPDARVPIENYLQGHATGKAEYIRKAFHPEARIQGFRGDGQFINWTLEEYAALFKGDSSPEEPRRKRRIEAVDVTGNAAVAKVVFDYPEATIVDYFLLLKKDGEWRIANKIFQGEIKRK